MPAALLVSPENECENNGHGVRQSERKVKAEGESWNEKYTSLEMANVEEIVIKLKGPNGDYTFRTGKKLRAEWR